MSTDRNLIEKLADLCHQQWSGWMSYLFMHGEYNEDGSFTIPESLVQRWQRQLETDYADLSDMEQFSDQKEAAKFQHLVYEHFQEYVHQMEKACVNLNRKADGYETLGLKGVADALKGFSWTMTSTAQTMLWDLQIQGESDRSDWE